MKTNNEPKEPELHWKNGKAAIWLKFEALLTVDEIIELKEWLESKNIKYRKGE